MNIEEIAFKNVEELICLRNISLLAIIDFLQKDRKKCLNQFAKTHNESVEILKENKELKKQLHDASIQIQELIEKDIWCPSNCEKLKELRKQYCERTDCSGRIGNSKKVEKLQQENKQLKEVINKAIEYINSQMIAYDDGEDCGVICECDGFKLLDILKEVE